jgi:hypothetical protein
MPSEPRPFFLSFEQALHDRLPRHDLMQAMEEAMWEFASMHRRDSADRGKRHDSLIRIGSICLAFFRLMVRSGYTPEQACERILQACQAFEGPLEPAPTSDDCAVAEYFLAKGQPALCEAAFCSRCIQKAAGCPSLKALKARVAPRDMRTDLGGLNGSRSGYALPAAVTAQGAGMPLSYTPIY